MHIGSYLKSVMESQRYSVTEIAKMVNKTETAVRKDFAKSELHMSVLNAYGKALKINVYKVLAQPLGRADDQRSGFPISETRSKRYKGATSNGIYLDYLPCGFNQKSAAARTSQFVRIFQLISNYLSNKLILKPAVGLGEKSTPHQLKLQKQSD